jgi:hypothetical protein
MKGKKDQAKPTPLSRSLEERNHLVKFKGAKGKVNEWYLPFTNETTNVSNKQ